MKRKSSTFLTRGHRTRKKSLVQSRLAVYGFPILVNGRPGFGKWNPLPVISPGTAPEGILIYILCQSSNLSYKSDFLLEISHINLSTTYLSIYLLGYLSISSFIYLVILLIFYLYIFLLSTYSTTSKTWSNSTDAIILCSDWVALKQQCLRENVFIDFSCRYRNSLHAQ